MELLPGVIVPDEEFEWSYARSGGPGGQNVNKVSSKAILRWNLEATAALNERIKSRLRAHERRRFTTEGVLVLSSQRYRDQERNREDCLEKLREMIAAASFEPKTRKPTKPTRGSKMRRLAEKQHRSKRKADRRTHSED